MGDNPETIGENGNERDVLEGEEKEKFEEFVDNVERAAGMEEKPYIPPEQDPETGRFVKGNSGGPGRPKGSFSLTDIMRQELSEVEPNSKKTFARLLIRNHIKRAIADGEHRFARDILEYMEGKPHQRVDVTSGDSPISPGTQIMIVQDDGDSDSDDGSKD